MAKKKKIDKIIKLQVEAGKANPARPVGPALGAAGLNIMGFCKEFNDRTKNKSGELLPVEITVFADKTYTFITKEPPVPNLIFTELGITKGSGQPNKEKAGKLKREQALKIAKRKMTDMGVDTEEAAFAMVAGTARSMGVDLED
jgi:large subunit ribosomal protein L11